VLGRRGSKIDPRLRRRRRRDSGTVGEVGLPSFSHPYSTAWSWQSGQTSTKSAPFGANRIACSPRRSERSQIAHVRVAVELVMRCTRSTIAPLLQVSGCYIQPTYV
jgi:hypothetical protein